MPLRGISNNLEEADNEFPMEFIMGFFSCEDALSSHFSSLLLLYQIWNKLRIYHTSTTEFLQYQTSISNVFNAFLT